MVLPTTKTGGKGEGSRAEADPELTGSNVYSVGEGVLLKWLFYHLEQANRVSLVYQYTYMTQKAYAYVLFLPLPFNCYLVTKILCADQARQSMSDRPYEAVGDSTTTRETMSAATTSSPCLDNHPLQKNVFGAVGPLSIVFAPTSWSVWT